MAKLKIRRDDTVEVISGKDKGKSGRVLRVEPKRDRVFVEGMNIQKRHTRPRSIRDAQRSEQVGGVVEKEGPIHISNVMVVGDDDKRTRVGSKVLSDGRKVRVSRRTGEVLDK